MLWQSFFQHEMVSIGCELNLPHAEQGRHDLTALSEDTLRDGCSLVARDVRTNRIVSIAINKIQYRNPLAPPYFEAFKKRCSSINACALLDLMLDVDALVDLFQHFDTDCLFEIMFLATLPEYKGRAIGTRLVEHAIAFARRLSRDECLDTVSDAVRTDPRRPHAVSAIWTSSFSQIVGDRAGFERIAALRYDERVFDGRTFADRIADERHPTSVLAGVKL